MSRKTPARTPKHAKRSDLAQKLLHQFRLQSTTRPGERIGVAVSGGADSVALFLLLLELREQLGLLLSLTHFNHKLRGRASDADERFVGALAARHDLPFFLAHEDVASKARRAPSNLEYAARPSPFTSFERPA